MLINLSEIPPEGRDYLCTEKTAELNQALLDLVRNCPYQVDFRILPMGNIFEVTGTIHSHIAMECTRCLKPFALNLNERIHELLIPGKELPRTGRESKVNHTSELADSGPSSSIVSFPNFDPGPLMRDTVALAQPDHPICSETCKGLCQHCGKNLNEGDCSCATVHHEDAVKPNPFSKLREMKF
jgi:uncharacterized protein